MRGGKTAYDFKKIGLWVGLALTAAVAFILARTATLNVFYGVGDLTDGAWLATIAWHNNLWLEGPPAFAGSFFSEHVSPIFWLTNILSYLLPLQKFDFFACIIGTTYALYACAMYRLWQLAVRFPMPVVVEVFLSLAIALVATFSAVGMQALRLPHHELMFSAFAVWFLVCLIEKKQAWAVAFFVLALLVREDSGFHLFGLLFLTLAAFRVSGKPCPDEGRVWHFAFAAMVFSILMMAIKNIMFADLSDGVFQRSYVGSPPWHHITADVLAQRWDYYVSQRIYFYVPLLLTGLWAFVVRNPLLPVGYTAFIPWVALSFFATNYTTSTMSYYYSFPLWVSLAWPLFAIGFWPEKGKSKLALAPYGLVLLGSLFFCNFGRWSVYMADTNNYGRPPFETSEGLAHREMTDIFVDYLVKNRKLFEEGGLGMDMGAQGLFIDHFDRSTWLQTLKDKQIQPDIIVYFKNSYLLAPYVLPLLQTGNYSYFYQVPDTPLCLAAKKDLTAVLPLPHLFVAADAPEYLKHP